MIVSTPSYKNTYRTPWLPLLLVLTGVVFGGEATLQAQDSLLFTTRVFTTEDGLPDRFVKAVAQDSTGRMWFGTRRGMVLFDGEDFRPAPLGEDRSVTDDIEYIQTAADGRLMMVRNRNQSLYYDPVNGETTSLTDVPDAYTYGNLYGVDQRTGVQLYKAPNKRVLLLGPETTTKEIELDVENVRGNSVGTLWNTFLVYDHRTNLYYEIDGKGATLKALNFWRLKSKYERPLIFPEGSSRQRYIEYRTASVKEKLNRIYSINKAGELKRIEFSGVDALADRSNDNFSYNTLIARDREGKFWITTKETLWVFDQKGQLLRDFSEMLNSKLQASWSANDILVDNDGNVWLATSVGIVLISQQKNPFRCYLTEGNENSVRGFHELPNGNILVGANAFTYILNVRDSTFKLSAKSLALGFGNGPDGEIVSGSYGPQIQVFADNGQALYRTNKYYPTNSQTPDNLTVPYYDEHMGVMFCGSSSALYHTTALDSLFTLYRPPNNPDLFKRSSINHLWRDADGLWAGGRRGLYLINEQESHLACHLPGELVKHFHRAADGTFWIATEGAGLFHWSPATDVIEQYTMANGLSSNIIYAVYEDEFGFLWLPSERGLMQFNLQTESVRVFLPEDGIAHEEFNTFSHFRASDGRFYFGGLDGITSFHPADITETRSQQPILLTGIRKFNQQTDRLEDLLPAYQAEGELVLPPGDRAFTVRFALRDYKSEFIDYAWRLEPGGDWVYQQNNEIRINSLDYGAQQLVVKARSNGTYWTPEPLRINLFAQRPFYQRWPFWLLTAAGVALLVWGYVRQRTQRLIAEQKRLTQTVALRTRELATRNDELTAANQMRDRLLALISHDLRAPIISLRNISRKVRFLVTRERFGEVDRLSSSIDTTVANTQHLLDNLLAWAASQRREGQVVTRAFNLANTVADTANLFRTIAEEKGVALTVCCPPEAYVKADPAAIATILRNLLDNAVKFSPTNGTVHLEVTKVTAAYAVEVSDSGKGIDPDLIDHLFVTTKSQSTTGTAGEKGIGLGLPLSYELARTNGGKLVVKRSDGRGTIFLLTILSV